MPEFRDTLLVEPGPELQLAIDGSGVVDEEVSDNEAVLARAPRETLKVGGGAGSENL